MRKSEKFRDKSQKRRKINRKRLQFGAISIVLTVTFIAAIVLANAGVSYLTDRYYLKADISAAGYYEISEQTEIMLQNLSEPVVVYILMSEADVQNSISFGIPVEFLKRYTSISEGLFQVELIDPYKNPTFMNQFSDVGSFSVGDFVITCGDRFRVGSLYDMYDVGINYDDEGNAVSQYTSGFSADEKFASLLHYVTTGQLPTVALIQGHDEYYGTELKNIFTKNNYEVFELSLLTEDIPSTTDLIVISGPRRDFEQAEIEKIDKYLTKDFGSAMVFIDIESGDIPRLNLYFNEWGVNYESAFVMDTERTLAAMPTALVPRILKTDMTSKLNYNNYSYVISPYTRTMNILWDERSARAADIQLVTSDASYGKYYGSDFTVSTAAYEEGDPVGPFPVSVYSQYWEWRDNRAYYGRVMFFATSLIIDDVALAENSAYFNRQFITATIGELTPTSDAISLTPRDLTTTTMVVLNEQANAILIGLVIVIPVLLLGLGIFVWVKRKNK